MDLTRIIYITIFVIIGLTNSGHSSYHNITEWSFIRRQKRTLIYHNAGVAKMVCGVIVPVDLSEKKPWRQLNLAVNLQSQFSLPTKPIYWWNKFDGRSLEDARKQFNRYGTYVKDQSRLLIYTAIEVYMKNAGKNGRKCLQRAICENAQAEAEGIFSEIIYLILTPNEDNIDIGYTEAYHAGKSAADCLDLYMECPLGDGLLDNISVLHTKKFLS